MLSTGALFASGRLAQPLHSLLRPIERESVGDPQVHRVLRRRPESLLEEPRRLRGDATTPPDDLVDARHSRESSPSALRHESEIRTGGRRRDELRHTSSGRSDRDARAGSRVDRTLLGPFPCDSDSQASAVRLRARRGSARTSRCESSTRALSGAIDGSSAGASSPVTRTSLGLPHSRRQRPSRPPLLRSIGRAS